MMENTSGKRNLIVDLTFNFALDIIEFCEILEENRKFTISKQLLRSGTAIGASISESQLAESKADFIHKLKIAEKEANETEYWLQLCKYAKNYPFDDSLIDKVTSIRKVLSKIITSSKSKKE